MRRVAHDRAQPARACRAHRLLAQELAALVVDPAARAQLRGVFAQRLAHQVRIRRDAGSVHERGAAAFVHTSSISAYSHLVREPLREDTPQLGARSWINYERSKFLREQSVRAAGARGLRTIVCNPAHIFGPGDTNNWSRL